jgi:hypothetical protein
LIISLLLVLASTDSKILHFELKKIKELDLEIKEPPERFGSE